MNVLRLNSVTDERLSPLQPLEHHRKTEPRESCIEMKPRRPYNQVKFINNHAHIRKMHAIFSDKTLYV